MKEFNLERALQGEPVKLRGGYKAFIKYDLRKEEVKYNGHYPLAGFYIDDNEEIIIETWQYDGCCSNNDFECVSDIVGMWEEPRPRVQLDLPAPLKEAENGQEIFCLNLGFGIVIQSSFDSSNPIKQTLLDGGLLFATKEEAEEWLDAMRNSRR